MVRGQKLEKLLSDHKAQNKSGRISATIVIFLLSGIDSGGNAVRGDGGGGGCSGGARRRQQWQGRWC